MEEICNDSSIRRAMTKVKVAFRRRKGEAHMPCLPYFVRVMIR